MRQLIPKEDGGDLTPLARAMRSQKRPAKVVEFPGAPGTKVAVVNPSDEEIAEAQAESTRYLREYLKLGEFELSLMLERNLYEAEEQRQLLVRALRDPVDSSRPFGTIEELREHLTPDVRKVLMRHLAAWMEERSPERKFDGDPQKIVEMVNDLKDEGVLSEYLTSCDFATLTSIALSLGAALPKRTEPSSSGTSSSS